MSGKERIDTDFMILYFKHKTLLFWKAAQILKNSVTIF
jgi:hypothetical protein